MRPIGRLAGAAERVSQGDLRVRVEVGEDDDEISALSETFNHMTSELEARRQELMDANLQLDARRRFTEAMLAGVSAGVVGLDSEGRITLINRTASGLLGIRPEEVEGRHYSECMPELAGLIRRAIIGRIAQNGGAGGCAPAGRAAPSQRAGFQRRCEPRLCGDLRRHHRSGVGAAHRGLG